MGARDHHSDKREAGSGNGASPTKWWQWVLIYPGLVLGMLGAIPTAIEAVKSYRLDIPFGTSADAEKQNELWVQNSECLNGAKFTPTRTRQAVEIATLICASGDVLLIGKRPEWEHPQKRWVSWSEIAPDKRAALFELFPTAVAAEPKPAQLAQTGPTTLMCQRWVGNGLLLQRVETSKGCFDQVVNTFNGWVVKSTRVACSPKC